MKIHVQIISMQGAMDEFSGERDIPEGTTASDLVQILDLPPEETCALMVNDIPVAVPERDGHILQARDRVTIFPPIKGG